MTSLTNRFDTDFLARLTVKRLAELSRTEALVNSLERSAAAAAERDAQRRKLDILARLNTEAGLTGPALRDMERYVSELKRYLQSVYDADLLNDASLVDITSEHCIGYAVHLLDYMAGGGYEAHGSLSVMELAAGTLQMFAGRPAAYGHLLAAGAVPVVVRLLSPLYPESVVVHMANAAGAMAEDFEARLAVRAHGGVGALVRLTRGDVEASVQAAAGAALSLLAARDAVVQDSVRHLGGIDNLVELVATGNAYVAEVARCALAALRRGNVTNQAEVIASLRGSSNLSRDLSRLRSVAELMRFEDGAPTKTASETLRQSHLLLEELEKPAVMRVHTPSSYRRPHSAYTGLARLSPRSPRTFTAGGGGGGSPTASSVFEAAAATHSSHSFGPAPAPASPMSPASPAAAAARRLTDGFSPARSTRSSLADVALAEVESELLRKKHLARFAHEEAMLLLEEMGFDALDLRAMRLQRVDGADLLAMREQEMRRELLLPSDKVHKLLALQAGVRLFDRIATGARQGRLSEIELRLYLAGHGATSAEVAKVLKLFCTLVRTDRFDFVAFWDFVTAYDWVAQAFRIYNIPA